MRLLSSLALVSLSLGIVAAVGPVAPSPVGSACGEEPKPFILEKFLGVIEDAKSHVKDHLDNLVKELENPEDMGALLGDLLGRKGSFDASIKKLSKVILGALHQLAEGDILEEHLNSVCGEFADYIFGQLKKGEKTDPEKVKDFLVSFGRCFGRNTEQALRDLEKLAKEHKKTEKKRDEEEEEKKEKKKKTKKKEKKKKKKKEKKKKKRTKNLIIGMCWRWLRMS